MKKKLTIVHEGVKVSFAFEIYPEAVRFLLEDSASSTCVSGIGAEVLEECFEGIQCPDGVHDALVQASLMLRKNLATVACEVLQNQLKLSLPEAPIREQ